MNRGNFMYGNKEQTQGKPDGRLAIDAVFDQLEFGAYKLTSCTPTKFNGFLVGVQPHGTKDVKFYTFINNISDNDPDAVKQNQVLRTVRDGLQADVDLNWMIICPDQKFIIQVDTSHLKHTPHNYCVFVNQNGEFEYQPL